MENIHQGNLSINIKEAVGTITFGHPAGNSLPGALLRKMAQSFLQLGQDSQVKVIILKSEGDRAFCGGASFDELLSIEDESSARYFFQWFCRSDQCHSHMWQDSYWTHTRKSSGWRCWTGSCS